MIVDSGKYFLYRHIRLDKNEPFYIGVGSKRSDRNLTSHIVEFERAFCKKRNPIWKNITQKTEYDVEIVLQSDSEEFILYKEKEFIKLYGRIDLKTGMLANLTDGGEGISNPSPETRSKISKALIGLKRSEYTKNLIRNSVTGSIKGPRPNHVRDKISIKNKGINNGMFGVKGVENKKSKTVYQYTIDGEFVRSWTNAREAQSILGINYKDISACALGRQKTTKGFIWKYIYNI